jgi:hypothetical protein
MYVHRCCLHMYKKRRCWPPWPTLAKFRPSGNFNFNHWPSQSSNPRPRMRSKSLAARPYKINKHYHRGIGTYIHNVFLVLGYRSEKNAIPQMPRKRQQTLKNTFFPQSEPFKCLPSWKNFATNCLTNLRRIHIWHCRFSPSSQIINSIGGI